MLKTLTVILFCENLELSGEFLYSFNNFEIIMYKYIQGLRTDL